MHTFHNLHSALELIVAYCPRSRGDYTASLLNAVLVNKGIIGRSGLKNVLA